MVVIVRERQNLVDEAAPHVFQLNLGSKAIRPFDENMLPLSGLVLGCRRIHSISQEELTRNRSIRQSTMRH